MRLFFFTSLCMVAPNVFGECEYTDVIYSVVGRFSVEGTFFGIGDQVFSNLSERKTTPKWGRNGGKNNQSPFDAALANGDMTYQSGFVRIRYPNQKNESGILQQSSASLIQWYFPLDFKQTNGAEVKINVDHSAGIVDPSLPNCGGGDAPCRNHAPKITDTLTALNAGKFKGQTLKWARCTPSPNGENSWGFIAARATQGPGCVQYNAFGNVNSESSMVPEAGVGDSYQTWNQEFQPFRFNGKDLLTATFTMSKMQIPNGTDSSNTWLEVTNSKIIKVIQLRASASECP